MVEQLWAPWRMQYIKQEPEEEGCFLCKAAASEDRRKNLVIHKGERSFCLLNRFPYNNGHLLIAPYEHKGDLCQLDEGERADLMATLCEMESCVRAAMQPHGFNIGINIGKVSGAGLPGHLHFHIVPRWEGDTNFMPVLADAKVIPQALEEVYDLLVKHAKARRKC